MYFHPASLCPVSHIVNGLLPTICHLPINPTQSLEVAIGIGGVCLVHSIIVALKGTRGIAKVAIDASEEVVGEHLLIGSAVGVVVIDHAQHGAVGGERLEVLVLCLCNQRARAWQMKAI